MLGKLIELAQPIELSEHDYTGLQQTLYTTLEHLENLIFIWVVALVA